MGRSCIQHFCVARAGLSDRGGQFLCTVTAFGLRSSDSCWSRAEGHQLSYSPGPLVPEGRGCIPVGPQL